MSEVALQLIAENKISKNPFIDLGRCDLKNELPSELFENVWLTSINLGDSYRTNTAAYQGTSNAGSDNIFDGDELRALFKFPNLRQLYLSNVQLRNLSFIHRLFNVNDLYIDRNDIEDISSLHKLTGLTYLEAADNLISDSGPLKQLSHLAILNLDYNPIKTAEDLVNLENILFLSLRSTGIVDISHLRKLVTTKYLYLDQNLIEDFSHIAGLTNILNLTLASCKIKDISFIENMKKLTYITLKNNQVEDVSVLEQFENLETINLADNKIQDFPEAIINANPKISALYLHGNPITNIPVDIFNHKDSNVINEVKDYFASLATPEEVYPCYEAKLLLVGRGSVGKSELAEALSTPNYVFVEGRKSTEGIRIKEWRMRCKTNEPNPIDFTINLWDFGGQEIYYGTHQFFLTKNSLYLLVWDARQEEDNVTFQYWLKALAHLSDNAPVLVVQNKADERNKLINEQDLKQHFPFIQNFYQTSCKYPDQFDLKKLKEDIISHLLALPHVGELWNVRRIKVRRRLEKDERDYISANEYHKICAEEGLQEEEAMFLSKRLHQLGIILHFQDDEILQGTVILKPEWATKAFYKIIDNEKIKCVQRGSFRLQDLREIWKEPYYADNFPELLQLMILFELCFPFQDQKRYIVPELCSATPSFELPQLLPGENFLRFEYKYDFMPKNILTRFICRKHQLIKGEMFWRSGVVLQDEDTIALLQASEVQNTISISIKGPLAKSLLYSIRSDISAIHSSQGNPPVREMIPCVCTECSQSMSPEYFDYNTLKKFYSKKLQKIRCNRSLEEVDIKMLTEGLLESPADQTDDMSKNASITQVVSETKNEIKTIRIFLASSSELVEDRKEFEIFINRQNKQLVNKGIFLELVLWEDFIDCMSKEGLQKEYNKSIRESEIFVSLFFSKVGQHTEEEFSTAWNEFGKSGKPFIYTYFKDSPVKIGSLEEDFQTVLNFRKKLKDLGHYRTSYENIDALKNHFQNQLRELYQEIL